MIGLRESLIARFASIPRVFDTTAEAIASAERTISAIPAKILARGHAEIIVDDGRACLSLCIERSGEGFDRSRRLLFRFFPDGSMSAERKELLEDYACAPRALRGLLAWLEGGSK